MEGEVKKEVGGAGDSHTKAVGWKEPNAGAN